jgi:hypothetical protein
VTRWSGDGGPTGPEAGRRRQRLLVALGALTAVALLFAIVVATRPGTDPAEGRAASTTSTASTGPSAGSEKSPAASTTESAVQTADAQVDQLALREVQAVAASLATPVALRSPVTWDQWLPEGKPYPGPSLEEEISTCPRLASRLTEVLGQEMSYWTGTLPNGPYGCTWVPVPLVYDSPDYDYVISVGFLADGTTAEQLTRDFRTATGPCPQAALPSAATGAVLSRCSTGTSTEYTLALPDTRLDGGLWTLIVNVNDRAAVPASEILPVVVEGAGAAFA